MKISLKKITFVLFIAFVYISILIYIKDYDLVVSTISGDYPSDYKLKIINGLYLGIFLTNDFYQIIIILTIAMLTGLNTLFLLNKINLLKSNGKFSLSFGGGTILALTTSGCAACGLPIFTLLGIGSSLAYLPFGGKELSFISIILLTYSLIMLKNLDLKCDLKKSSKKRNLTNTN